MEEVDLEIFIMLLFGLSLGDQHGRQAARASNETNSRACRDRDQQRARVEKKRKIETEREGGERERITVDERQNNVRSSRSSTLLDSIFIPVINSILVVHGSFIRGPTSRSLSFSRVRALLILLSLYLILCLIRAHTRTFIHLVSVWLVSYHQCSLPLLLTLICSFSFDAHVSLSLFASRFFLACFYSFPRSPFYAFAHPLAQPGASLPLVPISSLLDIFSLFSLPPPRTII